MPETFYESLSAVYDLLFPARAATVDFLVDGLPARANVLDLACGTGNYSIEMARRGYRVAGIDLDAAMVDAAIQKTTDMDIDFQTGDMTKAGEFFSGRTFHRAICIGNSIVHLDRTDAVLGFAKHVRSILTDDGMFIAQIVNFDRIIHNKVDSLPALVNEDHRVSLTRNYCELDGGRRVSFDTTLNVSGAVTTNSITLLALRCDEMKGLLLSAGFSSLDVYGDYKKSEYTLQSPAIIIRAHC